MPDFDTSAMDERMIALVGMIGRTGAVGFQVRYDDDEAPTVWNAVALYPAGRWEVAAGRTPVQAIERLTEHLIDGGACTHCGRPTGIVFDIETMPLGDLICWYQWDPELKTIRRGCEGNDR